MINSYILTFVISILESFDPFVRNFLTILKQWTGKDFDKIKLRLEDAMPGKKLQNVEAAYELFSLMVEAKLLSPDNLHFLARLFIFVDREDLRRELLKDQQFKGKLIVLKLLFVR